MLCARLAKSRKSGNEKVHKENFGAIKNAPLQYSLAP